MMNNSSNFEEVVDERDVKLSNLHTSLDDYFNTLMPWKPDSFDPALKIRRVRLDVIFKVLKWAEMTVQDDLKELALNYTPIHPSITVLIARPLRKGQDNVLYTDPVVPKDRLLQEVMNTKDKSRFVMLMAIDGLMVNKDGDKYDFKQYIDRYRFDRNDDDQDFASWWIRNDEDERAHVMAVRRMYVALSNKRCYTLEDYMKLININVRSVLNPKSLTINETASVFPEIVDIYKEIVGNCIEPLKNRFFPKEENRFFPKGRKWIFPKGQNEQKF